jgi:hypothetical protein
MLRKQGSTPQGASSGGFEMYLLEKGRRWVEDKAVEVAGEMGLKYVEGQWLGEVEPVYRISAEGRQQDLVFSPAWLVYCSNDLNRPMRGLVMMEIRNKLRALNGSH